MSSNTNFSPPIARAQIEALKKAQQQPTPLAYSVNGAVAASGLGRSTLYSLIADGRLERVKIGKRTLITHASLERLLTGEAA